MTDDAKPYAVNLWGSHPDAGNDDCWTGDSFATRDEALAAYREVIMFPDHSELALACGPLGAWEYVEIDGPDCHEVTQNPDRPSCLRYRREQEREKARFDREWQRERAMEAGMLHGIDAYNEEMES